MKLIKGATPNIWDEEWELGTINENTGEDSTTSKRIRSKNFTPVLPETTYWCQINKASGNNIYFYDEYKNYISTNGRSAAGFGYSFPTPANCRYIKLSPWENYGTTYNNDISINYPSTDHDYHPYRALLKSGGKLNALDIPNMASGEITLTEDVIYLEVQQDFGFVPNYLIAYTEDDIEDISNNSNIIKIFSDKFKNGSSVENAPAKYRNNSGLFSNQWKNDNLSVLNQNGFRLVGFGESYRWRAGYKYKWIVF